MSVVEKSTFRRNFQRWVQMNYGENSRTKTITRVKYNKICRYLLGEPLIETDAKFRFWVKSKGFRIVQSEDLSLYGTLYVPVKVPHTRSMEALYPYEEAMGTRTQVLEYRRVAVADDFFDIISSVHINERGIHVGQKKTYRAVANTYAFLPREAVSYYLMSCSTCKLRIQRCNSILLKHGRPLTPTSDLESSDAEASISSHDSDDESYNMRKLKKEPQESVFEENGARNGMISQRDAGETSLNGSQSHSLKDVPEDSALGRGLPPGYQTYTSEHKQEVINYAKETTVREAARKYCVPRSTVQVWCKHGTGIKKEKRSPVGGGHRLSYSNETDDKLLQWVIKEQENGTPVTKDAIQLQARNLVRDECPDFKASSGWVEKFMSRHNLAVATTLSSTSANVVRQPGQSTVEEVLHAISDSILQELYAIEFEFCIRTVMSGREKFASEPIPVSYVVASPASAPSPVGGNHSSYSPRGDGRSCTSEDTRSDSGRSDEEDDMDDGAASLENMAAPISHSVIREPPNLSEILKTTGLSGGPASGIKDEDDEDGEGDDGDGERSESGAVNPERLKAFNMFVRLFVDENLDRLVPISKQPKEKILAIIQSCQRQFPEFRDRARKRIRTYLKSCRRLKKLKEPLKRTADQMSTNPNMSAAQMAEVNNILASACASEVENSKRPRLETDTPATTPVTTTNMTATCMSVTSPVIKSRPSSQCQLSPSEIQAIRHLIQGYRESAAFLYRSADELEQLLPPP